MPSVNGYTTAKMVPIEDGTFTDANVVGDDLVFTRKDGTTKNAGAVRGDQGPIGPPGPLSQADIDIITDTVDFGAWTNLSFLPGWTNFGSTYAPGQFRYSDYEVQFRGMIQWTGATVTPAGAWQRVDIATLPVAIRPPLPLMVRGSHNGYEMADLRIPTDGVMHTYIYQHTGRSLTAGSWLTLQECRWYR